MEVSGQLHASIAQSSGRKPVVGVEEQTGCAPEPVWTFLRSEKPLFPAHNEPPSRRLRNLVTTLTELTPVFKNFALRAGCKWLSGVELGQTTARPSTCCGASSVTEYSIGHGSRIKKRGHFSLRPLYTPLVKTHRIIRRVWPVHYLKPSEGLIHKHM